jgi:translation initiation factor IF-2
VPEAAPPVKPVEIPKPPIAPAAAPAPTAPAAKPVQPPAYAPLKKIQIDERTTIRELSEKISKSPVELIKKLLSMGAIATITQRVDRDVASLILHEFGYEAEFVSMYKEETLEQPEEGAKLKPRAPIVTVMGHVDHGKTSLLDAIRKTHVTEQEFGGITQHIGAYKVKTPKGDIVFLDTPGHEAFTAMRAHGAKVTDLVILVVAADDGVMPQTVEAIDHARAAGVPIIVAINKIDLPKVNPQNVKQQLSQHGLLPEDWGGDVMMVEISARNNINIDKLLETVLFRAELLELKANPDRPGRGVVIEARLDPGKGPLATILLQTGTIKAGDAFVCGLTTGKVRALIDDKGKRLLSAVPSTPVEVLGFSGIPSIGDRFAVVKDERLAREMISKRRGIIEESRFRRRKMATLADLAGGKIKELNIIIKTDVHGSLNAVRDSLERFDLKEIRINTIHSGVGAINESDVNLAITSNALIIGFNVRPDPNAEAIAKRDGVDIRTYKIIYELLADIKKALEGMLEPKTVETVIGRAEIKKTFPVSKVGNIAGCLVTDGKATRSASVRLIRNASVVYEGKIASLKRFKEDVREVEKGYECGILLENYNDVKVDDVLEFYVQEKVAGELNASV